MPKILLVEDDPLNVRLYRKKLTKEGFDVVVATDGSEGLAKAEREAPDLILLDVLMPKMSGYAMLEAMRPDERLRRIPVVVLTNLTSEWGAERIRALGIARYLTKAENPPDAVVAVIRTLLGIAARASPPAARRPASARRREKRRGV